MVTTSFLCESPEQTYQLGQLIGHQARPGEIWALSGNLGAGKTLFVQGLAKGLGFEGPVTSPTFTLAAYLRGTIEPLPFRLVPADGAPGSGRSGLGRMDRTGGRGGRGMGE